MEITIEKYKEKTLEDIRGYNHPFDDDLLDRKAIADHLAQIIKNTKSPFVFNINAPYGTGKTFFLRRLKVLLEKDKCAAVLYNSWETDWVNDPFVAILEELSEEIYRLFKSKDSVITEAAKKTWEYVKSAVTGLGKELVKYCPPAEFITSATQTALEIKNGTEPDLSYITKYYKIKEAKAELKKNLTEFASELGKPLIIIIDELDRCRPDYAIRTLEAIKHFFNIPNIVFVLAIDRQQIESAVSVLYGKKIETHSAEYLCKFIDYDFYLPSPDSKKFLKMLLKFHIKDTHLIKPFCVKKSNRLPIFTAIKRNFMDSKNNPEDNILIHLSSLLNLLSQFFKFSLRAQEQILLKMRMFVSALSAEHDILLPELLTWNVCLYSFDNELYHKFTQTKSSNYILETGNYITGDTPLLKKNIDFKSLNKLLKPQENPNISLSYPLNEWIDNYLLKPHNSPSTLNNSIVYVPFGEESVQKYLEITPLL